MLLILFPLKAFSVFLHDNLYCPQDFRGDGICDRGCMTKDSFFDTSKDSWNEKLIFQSDCISDCLKKNCTMDLLENNKCDSECNNWECGWDNQKCGFCAEGCFSELLENNVMDSVCNSQYCFYDNGKGGWCASGCFYGDLNSSEFKAQCNVTQCSYQNGLGLKDLSECSDGCTLNMLSNSYCDEECNNQKCGWDNKTCLCSDNCTTMLMTDYQCTAGSYCLNENCEYLDYACPVCAENCLQSSLGDGTCDEACNTESCDYDRGDCGCAPGCNSSFSNGQWNFVGQCSLACLVESCMFNYGACNDTFLQEFAMTYALANANYNSPFSITYTNTCTLEMMKNFSSTNKCSDLSGCDKEEFLYCNGYSDSPIPNCLKSYDMKCLVESGGTYFRNEKIDLAPPGKQNAKLLYQAIGTLRNFPRINANIYWVKEGSYNRKFPNVVNVTENNGFYDALALTVSPFNLIYIKPGTFNFSSSTYSFFYADSTDPLLKSSSNIPQYELQIIGEGNERPTIQFMEDLTIGGSFKRLIITNIKFTGKYLISNTCNNDLCYYCPEIISVGTDMKMSDKNIMLSTKDLESYGTNCAGNESYIPFDFKNKVLISNVNFENFQSQTKNLIKSNDSLTITDSVFNKVQPMDENPLILIESTSESYFNVSLTIENTQVIDFNYGYEHIEDMQQGYFLKAVKIGDVLLKNIDFQFCMSISCIECSDTSLIYFQSIEGEISIQECTFKNMYVDNLITVNVENLNYNSESYDVYGIRKQLNQMHFRISDCEFKNIYAQGGFIAYFMGSTKHNILVENCYFQNIAAMENGIFFIKSTSDITNTDSEGEWSYKVIDGTRKMVFDPSRTCVLNNVTIEDMSVGNIFFYLSMYPNIQIKSLTVKSIREPLVSDPYTFSIKYFSSEKKYLSTSPISSLIPINEIISVISFASINYALLETLSFQNISSSSLDFSSIFVMNPDSNITINGYKLSTITVKSRLAAAFLCDSVPNVIASNIEVYQVNNNYSGLISFDQTTNITLSGVTFKESSSNFSAAIKINEANKIEIDEVSAFSFDSYDSKGTLMNIKLGAEPKSVVLNEILIENSNSLHGQGLVLYLDCLTSVSSFIMNLSNLQVINSTSKDSLIYLASNLYLKQGNIENFYVSSSTIINGALISDVHYSGTLTITNLTSVNNTAFLGAVYGSYRNDGVLLEIIDSVIMDSICTSEVLLLEGNSNSTINANNLIISNTSSTANIISLDKVIFRGNNLVEKNIKRGIGIFVTMASLELTNSSFYSISTTVIFSMKSTFSCDSCNFETVTNSIFSFYQETIFDIKNSNFLNCIISDFNMIYAISTKIKSNFTNCLFQDNILNKELMLLETSKIDIEQSQFKNNQLTDASCIKVTSGTLDVTSSFFKNQTNSYISATLQSKINVTSSQFSGLEEVYEELTDNYEINSQLLNEKSISFVGGAIYVKESELVVDSSDFFYLFSKSGGAIYSDDSIVTLNNSNFFNCSTSTLETSGIVYLNQGNLTVENSSFSDSLTQTSLIYGLELKQVKIYSSEFKNNYNTNGGAIFAESEENYPFILKDSIFYNNSASVGGGAISIENFEFTISNCSFLNNQAKSKGGALYLDTKQCKDCIVTFISPSTFSFNSCPNCSGGAIYWQDEEPVNLTSNIFHNNSARYGPDQASVPTNIQFFDSRRLTELENFKPGGNFSGSFLICLYDSYDQIVDNVDYDSYTGVYKSYDGTTVSGSEASLKDGCFNITGFIVKGTPGGTGNVYFEVPQLNDNKNMKGDDESSEEVKNSLNFSVSFRNCTYGEKRSENECSTCDKGKYLIENAEICKSCPSGAECLGGYLVLPTAGYWKLNMYSSDILACPVTSACLGSATLKLNDTLIDAGLVDSDVDFTGTCAKGYTGHLCASCELGYSKSTSGECTKCPSSEVNSLIITSIIILMLIISYIMVTSTLKSAFSAKSLHSIYIKIFTNYLQIIFLTTQFNLNWPTYVMTFFNMQKTAASASDQLYSIDCFFSEKSSYSNEEIYYFKLLTAALLPPLIWAFSFVIWLFVCFFKETYSYIKRELFTTMIVLFFLIHPNIVKTIFSSFSCREIKSIDFWLVDNLEIQCFTASHYKTLLTVSVPCIVLWGFGVPTVVLIIMVKKSRDLGKDHNKVIFGFIYNGFKHSKFFWEFVILYRKIFIICISVFMSQGSTTIQALTVVVLLLIALYLQYSQHPYNCKQLNYMEIEALLTATLTIYCGLYYLSDSLNEAIKSSLFAMIIIGNCYFLVYWFYYMSKAFVDIIVNFFPILRIWLKKGDFIKVNFYEQKLSSQGVYFDKSDGEKKYTFFRSASHGLQTKIKNAKCMTDLFKLSMIEKLKFEAFSEASLETYSK